MRKRLLCLSMVLTACGGAGTSASQSPAKVATTAPSNAAPLPAPTQRAALDASAIGTATGGKPEVSEKVVKVSFAREDVAVDVDGFAKMPPFMGLTSWAAFTPGEKPGVEAMVMGDLVVFEDEVNQVMSAALDHGLEVTALHNHFFFDKPRVFFMHIGGEGTADGLAKGVRAALDAQKAVRAKSAQPTATFGAGALSTPSKIDPTKLDAVFGIKGTAKDGMYKAVMGRKATASCGCSVGKTMGVNTIHHHMTGESPRILFLHYWGRGSSKALAGAVKSALDLTSWDGKTVSAPAR